MLTGDVPFRGTDREEMLGLIALGVQARPSRLRTDLPLDAEALVLSALHFKAVMRPRDARAFGYDLAKALRKGEQRFLAPRTVRAEVPVPILTETTSEITPQPEVDERRVERKRAVVPKPPSIVSDRTITWSLIVLLLAAALSIPIVQTLFSSEQKTAAVSSIVNKPASSRLPRELKYAIVGQNIKNTASMESQPTLQTRFVNSEYNMIFEADSAGNAYVFSEAGDENGRIAYNVLYPLAKVNNGSARIEPGQQAKTRPGIFFESRNPEIVWLVWTAGTQNDLESVRRSALEGDGVVRNENDVQKLRHFLERGKNFKLDMRKDEADQQTVLNGSGDKIVHRIEIEHN